MFSKLRLDDEFVQVATIQKRLIVSPNGACSHSQYLCENSNLELKIRYMETQNRYLENLVRTQHRLKEKLQWEKTTSQNLRIQLADQEMGRQDVWKLHECCAALKSQLVDQERDHRAFKKNFMKNFMNNLIICLMCVCGLMFLLSCKPTGLSN